MNPPTIQPQKGPDPKYIQNLFSSIATTYDRANDVITFGRVRAWRQHLVRLSKASKGDKVLDCATGTGDLAFAFKRAVGSQGQVIGTDFCQEMLDPAPAKAKALGLDVQFSWADVTQLQYDNDQFHITSMSYGIRNVNDPMKALSEMARVTQPKGKVMILETGENRIPIFGPAIQIYFRYFVPRLGGWVSGQREAYEYLHQSSNKFPCRENFLNLMEATKAFSHLKYKSLMGGASFIYTGVVKSLV